MNHPAPQRIEVDHAGKVGIALHTQERDEDDATVVVVRNTTHGH